MDKYNLQTRLISFSVSIINLSESLPKTYAGAYLSKQICRSGTSPALNYAEAQAAESRADFIHKNKVALKELRETFVCLQIIALKKYMSEEKLELIQKENNELIAIMVTIIKNSKLKLEQEKRSKRKSVA